MLKPLLQVKLVKYHITAITPCWWDEGDGRGEVLLLWTSKGAILCLFPCHG